MKHKSIVTEYTEISAFSGVPAEQWHHLIWGDNGAKRTKADEDQLILPLTADEHTTGKQGERVHGNPAAEKLSKFVGQLAWEKEYYRKKAKADGDPARDEFRKRYGKSYL